MKPNKRRRSKIRRICIVNQVTIYCKSTKGCQVIRCCIFH
jgi:hypothetical protein